MIKSLVNLKQQFFSSQGIDGCLDETQIDLEGDWASPHFLKINLRTRFIRIEGLLHLDASGSSGREL